MLRRLLGRNRRGTAALEFAIAAPVLLVLVIGTVDVTRYVMTTMRVHRVASSVSDIGAQFEKLHDSMTVVRGNEVGVLFLAAREIGGDLNLTVDGTVIVTVVADTGNGLGPRIMWQRRAGPAGPKSSLGDLAGARPVLPAGFTLAPGESALFAEVTYGLRPYLFSAGLIGADPVVVLTARSVNRPRKASLNTLEPTT